MTIAFLPSRAAGVFRRIGKLPFFIVAGVVAVYLLFAWLALPSLLQSQAEAYVLRQSGHHLTMDRPVFDPLRLRLRLTNLRLTEPDGKALLAFKTLAVDLSASSLVRRAYVFDEISLDGLDAAVVVLPKNRLNWSAFLQAFQSKERKPSSELPRLIVGKFLLSRGQLYLADRRTSPERSTRLVPLNLELDDLSSLPNEKGQYQLTAKTNFGANIAWNGVVALKPLSIAGQFHVDSLVLPRLAPYLPLPTYIKSLQGVASFSTRYEAGMIGKQFNLRLDKLAFRLDGFKVEAKNDPTAALSLGRVDLTGGRFDLRSRSIVFQALTVAGGSLNAVRDAKGKINVMSLLPPPTKKTVAPPPAAHPLGWHYRLAQLHLSGFSLAFQDKGSGAHTALEDISADIGEVNENLTRPLPVHAAFRAQDGGSFEAQGTVVPTTASADLQIKLDGLALTPAQPYIGQLTTLKLLGGSLSSEGRAVFDGKNGSFSGSMAIRDLRITEADGKQTFLAWKSLSTTTLEASKDRLAIRELLLNGLDTRLIVAKDHTINFTKIFRQKAGSAPQPAAPAAEPTAGAPPAPQSAPTAAIAKPPLFPVQIGRIRISNSQLEFADLSLAFPFGTHIHALNGTLVHISTKPGAPARLQIEGQIDEYGMARAEGRLNLFNFTELLDVKTDFTNVEMNRLTPYSATFAGRKIESGKLTMHLEYKIQKRQLVGNNQIIMDQLTLGEQVKSPQAHDLPLDIAIAILEDSNGRIDLGLPVSGSLDDPKFSYGQIVWKAIVNVLTKIVTSPFRALGALFGSDEQFDGIVFVAGRSTLTPPEREKLVSFATALNKRPKLSVILHGTYSEADRTALQDLQLRKAIAGKLGLSTEGDPGLLTPDQPKVKAALETLYAKRFGSGGLAAMKDGFGKANPGKLETSTSGKLVSLWTGLIGSKEELSDKDIAGMRGTDFHVLLYRKLAAAEAVPDAALLQLAQARAAAVMAELHSTPADRVKLEAVEKTDAKDKDVLFKIDMGTAAAAAPAAN